jgi:polyhydroxybutyrate depolymerase
MALRVACVDAGSFAAIGLLISAMPDAAGSDCHPPKPLPVLMVNGTGDRIVPYAGGQSQRGDNLWPTERLVGFFRQLNGCAEAPQQSVLPGQHPQKIEIERSSKCSGGHVIFYRIIGGGHDVPPALNAAQLLLDFFRDKVR